MKLVIINDFGWINGGASKVAIDSACALARRGLEVTFFCAVGPVDPSLDAAGVMTFCLNQTVSLDNPSRLKGAAQNLWNAPAARALGGLLNGMSDAVAHVHVWTKALSAAIFPVFRSTSTPLVITLHDYFSVCPNGARFSYQRAVNCEYRPGSLACLTHNCEKGGNWAIKNFRSLRYILQDRIAGLGQGGWRAIAVSDFSLSLIRPYLPPDVRSEVVFNPGPVNQRPAAAPERSDIFLAVGRLVPEKGMVLFAEAAGLAGVRAVFVGQGEEEAAIAAINPRAELLGWANHDATMEHIARARSLVFSSLWPETQGLVVDEAASLGVPAIVSNNTAARDRVKDDDNGLHFRSNDLTALVRTLRRLRDDDTLVQRLGAKAHADYWAAPRGMDQHISALERIYRDSAQG